MKAFVYLSLIPEALIASHLPPEQFGHYFAVGPQNRSRGQAIFFKLTDSYAAAQLVALRIDPALNRSSPAEPRRSLYLSVYRVLEQTPVEALETLHLATVDGRVLTLQHQPHPAEDDARFHLYQELCPATPRIVSLLGPQTLARHITDSSQRVSLPAVVFADLRLDGLSRDPDDRDVNNLPYGNLEHLRDCLRELRTKPNKMAKTVIRDLQHHLLFRTLRRGFYVAAQGGDSFRYFPMPTREELETVHAKWWKSANT
jgi:hypothetical protein